MTDIWNSQLRRESNATPMIMIIDDDDDDDDDENDDDGDDDDGDLLLLQMLRTCHGPRNTQKHFLEL